MTYMAAMIKGISVILHVKQKTGVDAFNRPVYTYAAEQVDNVLVSPTSTDDIVTSQDLYGKKQYIHWQSQRVIPTHGKTVKLSSLEGDGKRSGSQLRE